MVGGDANEVRMRHRRRARPDAGVGVMRLHDWQRWIKSNGLHIGPGLKSVVMNDIEPGQNATVLAKGLFLGAAQGYWKESYPFGQNTALGRHDGHLVAGPGELLSERQQNSLGAPIPLEGQCKDRRADQQNLQALFHWWGGRARGCSWALNFNGANHSPPSNWAGLKGTGP